MDPVIVRILFILTVFANGLGLLLYLVLWVAVPQETHVEHAPAEASSNLDSAQHRMARAVNDATAYLTQANSTYYEFKRRMGRPLTATLGMALVFLGVIGALQMSKPPVSSGVAGSSSPNTGPTPAAPKAATRVPVATSTPDVALANTIKSHGTLNMMRRVTVAPSEKQPGKWDVATEVMVLNVFDSPVDGRMVEGSLVDFLSISRTAFSFGIPIDRVFFAAVIDVPDSYGNSRSQNLAILSLSDETAAKINWNSITHVDLWRICDKAMVNQAFLRNVPTR